MKFNVNIRNDIIGERFLRRARILETERPVERAELFASDHRSRRQVGIH